MVWIPGAVIFVNNDLTAQVQAHLVRQLQIDNVETGAEYDANVAADANYPDIIRQLNRRVMVVRTFEDRATVPSWTTPDVVIFVKAGLAAIEVNFFGPKGLTFPVSRLYWGQLGVYGNG